MVERDTTERQHATFHHGDGQSSRGVSRYPSTTHVFEIIIKITKQIILIYFIFNKPYQGFYKLIHK